MMGGKEGRMIAFYGMNNVGKSTVVGGVVRCLGERGMKTQYLKYPIYDSPTGRRINDYLRHGNPEGLSAQQAQEIYAEDRRQFEPSLRSYLKDGTYVVAEDYTGTGICWGQICGVPLGRLEEFNNNLFVPDLSILLDGIRFDLGKEANHKHEGMCSEDWQRGRKIHQGMALRYGWKVVKSDNPPEQVLADVMAVIDLELEVRGSINN